MSSIICPEDSMDISAWSVHIAQEIIKIWYCSGTRPTHDLDDIIIWLENRSEISEDLSLLCRKCFHDYNVLWSGNRWYQTFIVIVTNTNSIWQHEEFLLWKTTLFPVVLYGYKLVSLRKTKTLKNKNIARNRWFVYLPVLLCYLYFCLPVRSLTP